MMPLAAVVPKKLFKASCKVLINQLIMPKRAIQYANEAMLWSFLNPPALLKKMTKMA